MVTTSLPAANPFALRWHFIVHGKAEQLPLPMLQPLLKAGPRVMGTSRRARKEEEKPGQLCSSFRCKKLGPAVGREHPASHGCCLCPARFPLRRWDPAASHPVSQLRPASPITSPGKGSAVPLHPGKPSWRSTFPEAALGSSPPASALPRGTEQPLLHFPPGKLRKIGDGKSLALGKAKPT